MGAFSPGEGTLSGALQAGGVDLGGPVRVKAHEEDRVGGQSASLGGQEWWWEKGQKSVLSFECAQATELSLLVTAMLSLKALIVQK